MRAVQRKTDWAAASPCPEPEFGTFTLRDGTRLRTAFWRATGERVRGTVLVLTGRAEFVEKYEETVGELLARGFQVAGFDWRGQGLSDRPLANRQVHHIEDFSILTDDLDEILRDFVEPLAAGPLVLLAHSMGGLPAVMHLLRHGERYAAAVLSAPMFDFFTGPVPRRLAVILADWYCGRGRAAEYALGQGDYKLFQGTFTTLNFITSDPRRYAVFHDAFRKRPELRVGGVSFGWIRAALRASDHLQREAPLERVKTPVLIVSAPNDRVVRAAAHRLVAARLGNATLKSYPEGKHELLMERDEIRDRVWGDIDRFLEDLPV